MAHITNVRFNPDLERLRFLAGRIPGALPTAINIVKVAETIRTRNLAIEGEPATRHVMARTAHQIVYPEGTVFIDSGLDHETHLTFGKGPDPYFDDVYSALQDALLRARLIIISHYHGDHVAGVLRSPHFDRLAPRTLVTAETARLLIDSPHKPTLVTSAEKVGRFTIVEYQAVMPVAPGLVLIKAPGHTPDSQMAFITLADGREFVHSVDSAWHMDNIRLQKQKAAPWVKEDREALADHLRWLRRIDEEEPNVTVLVSHDDDQLAELTRDGALGSTLT